MSKALDLTNQTFGRLTVIKLHHVKNKYRRYWLCKCECGNETVVYVSNLTTGKTTSCGCYVRENIKNGIHMTHGLRNHRLYGIWVNMKTRCYNSKSPKYKRYGGRGIKICDEWLDNFMNFYNWSMDHGYKDDLSIDRINNDGNYEPSNCRWTTAKEQASNKSTTNLITFNGKTQCVKAWTEELGFSKEALRERLKRGWSIEKALTTPIDRKRVVNDELISTSN